MFFHGIDYKYLLYQYPILSPRLTILRQNKSQKMDRKHLIEKFGFEPVHFLESSKHYSVKQCLDACFTFGNVIFAYRKLPYPMIQLSVNEVGVSVIDTRNSDYIVVKNPLLIKGLKEKYHHIPIYLMMEPH